MQSSSFFLPKQMLAFSWNAPPLFAAVRESAYETWVVVDFEEYNHPFACKLAGRSAVGSSRFLF
ncbi:MAG: hypothetical protein LC107_07740 [Chitinophagales bacterium]|nr:hypothetical protein [Chitinophagales bacterium]